MCAFEVTQKGTIGGALMVKCVIEDEAGNITDQFNGRYNDGEVTQFFLVRDSVVVYDIKDTQGFLRVAGEIEPASSFNDRLGCSLEDFTKEVQHDLKIRAEAGAKD